MNTCQKDVLLLMQARSDYTGYRGNYAFCNCIIRFFYAHKQIDMLF